jgi:hypothetical protein
MNNLRGLSPIGDRSNMAPSGSSALSFRHFPESVSVQNSLKFSDFFIGTVEEEYFP